MVYRQILCLCALCWVCLFPSQAFSQDKKGPAETLTLVEAVMCESVREFVPVNQGVVFSSGIGRVHCYSSFDPVPNRTAIYHNWFHRDQLSSKQRLVLNPPRWSTFSTMQLREGDRGPWRVEVTDGNGHLLKVLRFSITD